MDGNLHEENTEVRRHLQGAMKKEDPPQGLRHVPFTGLYPTWHADISGHCGVCETVPGRRCSMYRQAPTHLDRRFLLLEGHHIQVQAINLRAELRNEIRQQRTRKSFIPG